jgi:hypothetical protein
MVFQPGQSGNPQGSKPLIFQTLNARREHYLTTLTRQEIIDTAASDAALDLYSSWDAQVLIGLAETLERTPKNMLNPANERERLYDRTIGKAAQNINVDHTGSIAVFAVDLSPLVAFVEEEDAGEATGTVQALLPA